MENELGLFIGWQKWMYQDTYANEDKSQKHNTEQQKRKQETEKKYIVKCHFIRNDLYTLFRDKIQMKQKYIRGGNEKY